MNWQLLFVTAIILAAALFTSRALLRTLRNFRRPKPGCSASCGCGTAPSGRSD